MKIEKGIPLNNSHPTSPISKTLQQMEVGDSVLVKRISTTNWRVNASRYGIKIAERKVNETKARIWRIS